MKGPKTRRIAIDAVVTFILTFGAFWWKFGRATTDTTTLIGIVLIWIAGAVLAAMLFESLVPKILRRPQK